MIMAAGRKKPTGKEDYLWNPGLMTVDEARAHKDVSKRAVMQRIGTGKLPVMVVGNVLLVRRDDLDKWDVDRKKQDQKSRKKPAKE